LQPWLLYPDSGLSSPFYPPHKIMPYSDQLSPWVVYRLLPNFQRILLERFRKRTNAEDYARVLKQIRPQFELAILFEIEQTAKIAEHAQASSKDDSPDRDKSAK
jgi:hypothetical protein